MKKVVQRLLVFFLGIPLTFSVVSLTYYHHLALNLVLILTSILSSCELCHVFNTKCDKGSGSYTENPALLSFLSFCIPLSAYLLIIFDKHIDYASIVFFVCAMVIMSTEIFRKNYKYSNIRICKSVFVVFYCGFFCTFITRMTLLDHSTIKICFFFFIVFISDSAAWFFGVLFGRNNKGIVAASPNKSIAGFVGGFFGAIVTCVLVQFFMHKIFPGNLLKGVILGALCNVASVTGDLVESVFKRSAGIKDSGRIVPGRGGILDCTDSIFFAAPVYYVLAHLMF